MELELGTFTGDDVHLALLLHFLLLSQDRTSSLDLPRRPFLQQTVCLVASRHYPQDSLDRPMKEDLCQTESIRAFWPLFYDLLQSENSLLFGSVPWEATGAMRKLPLSSSPRQDPKSCLDPKL